MIHLTLQQLSCYLDGELTEASTELIRRHLSECAACTGRFARIEAQEEIMARILVDEPDDAFFERLKDSLEPERSPGAAPKRPEKRRGQARGKKPKPIPVSPPPVAPAPAREAASAGARTPEPPPAGGAAPARAPVPARATTPRRREDDLPARHGTLASRVAFVALCLLLASVAWVVLQPGRPATRVAPVTRDQVEALTTREPEPPPAPTRTEPETTPAPSSIPDPTTPAKASEPEAPAPPALPAATAAPATTAPPATPAAKPAAVRKTPVPAQPETLFDRRPQNVVPVRTIVTETVVDPDGRVGGAPQGVPTPSAISPTTEADRERAMTRTLAEARSASLRAAQSKDPGDFDAAADSWERAIPMLGSSPEDLARARREVAQARFQAWAESPSASRREAAIGASRVYLLYAPPGPERDQAWTWLARLKQ